MHPILCSIGPLTIYSFGFMLAMAVLVCSYLFGRDTQKAGIPKETAYDFVFWTALTGVIGARVFYILLNLDIFMSDPSEIIKLQNGGLAWQGGLIFSVANAFFYLRKHRLPVLKFLDLAAPYGALGQAIGRIGCFLNGCCYGKPVWWGPYFPVHDAHLHPTQIYESSALFAGFIVLRILNKKNLSEGRVFAIYLMFAAAVRFIVQFFRDDHDPVWFGLSIFQWVCIGVLLAASVFFNYLRQKTETADIR
jgi:phosphatidylglycerol---prolipoprotein diacylglyceryl transferase